MTTGGARQRSLLGSAPPAATLVVGVGNEQRGDDGAGPLVARGLLEAWSGAPPPGVDVLVLSGDLMGLLDACRGVERLVVIDALVSGAAPGTCRQCGLDAPFRSAAATSSHGFGLAPVLALAASLGALPARVEVWGIEGARFDAFAPLSEAVAAAVASLVARLARELGDAAPEAPAR